MASNVWVLYAAKSYGETFIRGSEITEVRVSTGSSYSYGKEIETSTVRASYPGAEFGSVDLWKFRSREAADEAVQALLAALAADPCGVVIQDNNGKVGVRPLPKAAE
ncbi:hypothetical protein EIL87_19815 [Saccharopolyspora rhizosphaerae]|uniref:Uncharacterized protein n=1 Tax=Saccharopolyspora rhizosphaerae TaxID=2492662 RepID=A0A426JMV5_9PSEU|nr:hypothetical protein [Saccharopolyspora rhizosphaerae]RRO14553.1 hypothetical protein EIL87_19815 [Saccharopolyspora rhizosphaerae]